MSIPEKTFSLTAQAATLDLGAGHKVDTWTFNGAAPGPELRVQQGDLVVVALRNQDISAGVTLHWHGVAVPNAMDGVAGVTQDAVRPGEAFTYRFIAKQVNLYVPPIVVEPGQLVRIHVKNSTDDLHPMHLHGHSFMVLAKNGQPLVGSPVELDTLALGPGEAYDIAFRADNPGLWMDHCHVLRHAAKRMSIMVVYPNIVTPFNVGQVSGNHPE